MATFREIDERLLALVDEDGEILDLQEFQQLQMEREQKAENMGLWIMDLRDEQEALKREIDRLQNRLHHAADKEARLRDFLGQILGGEKLKTARISVSYRSTEAVEIEDEEAVRRFAERDNRYEDILRYKQPEISKTEIKRLIQSGTPVPGAKLAPRTSLLVR